MLTDQTGQQEGRLKSRQEVLDEFRRKGINISAWARQHKISRTLVHQVLTTDRPCRFGQSHKVAVLLGIKDGEIIEDSCNTFSGEGVAQGVAKTEMQHLEKI